MLHQQRSGKLAKLKYLVALPICGGLLCASTLAFSKNYGWIEVGSAKMTTAIADTLRTPKGFKYKEKVYTENGNKVGEVTFYEGKRQTKTYKSAPMTEAKLNLLKQHYGYEFPKGTVPPPPPPMPPKNKKMDVVKFPPPVVKPPKPKVDKVRFPPPIVIEQTVTGKIKWTNKHYAYEDGGFIADNKGDMFVIIYENGKAKAPFYRNSATEEQIKTLKNKYGYKFPDLKIYSEMPPPPPPMAPTAPAGEKKAALRPVNLHGGLVINDKPPLIVVNDKPYVYTSQQLNDITKGGAVDYNASDSIVYNYDNRLIKSKWGLNADNAVALYGKTNIVVK